MSQGGNKDNKAPPSLADKLNSEKTGSLFSSAWIYRVPEHFRKLNESAYTPRLIAIGPLHLGNEQLGKHMQIMQDVKIYYTKRLLYRRVKGIKDEKPEGEKMAQVLRECVEKLKEKEGVDEAKKYYAEEVGVMDNKMLEMMLVDGCFILELLYNSHSRGVKNQKKKETVGTQRYAANEASSSSFPPPTEAGEDGSSGGGDRKQDPILDNSLTAAIVKRDLLLLENQVPFFVLDELFKLTVAKILKNPGENKVSLIDYVVSYFRDIMSPKSENSGSETKTSRSLDCILWVCGSFKKMEAEAAKKKEAEANHYYHILHLLHNYYGPDQGYSTEKSTNKMFSELEVRASDLEHAGVNFVSAEGNNLFDVEFKEPGCLCWFRGAKFKIANLHIHDPTEPFLRNLIALEQCCPRVLPHFTSYAKLMNMLINSEKDIQVLKKANVIHNYLVKDKDIAELFNNLCNEIVLGDFDFFDECQKASDYSNRRWPQFRGMVKGKYFSSRWSFIGFVVTSIFFVLQITLLLRHPN